MVLEKFQEKFSDEILERREEKNDLVAVVRKNRLRDIFEFLKNDLGFEFLIDVCGVDRSKLPSTLAKPDEARFEAVYQFYSLALNQRLRLRVRVPEGDVVLPSALPYWKSADWAEREAYDMFGFIFEGHPHLKRLLLFEEFEGHPLRKDYPMARRQKIPVPETTPA